MRYHDEDMGERRPDEDEDRGENAAVLDEIVERIAETESAIETLIKGEIFDDAGEGGDEPGSRAVPDGGQAVAPESIFETLAEGVLVLDGQGTVLHDNTAARRLLGRRRDDLVGHRLDELMSGARHDGKPVEALMDLFPIESGEVDQEPRSVVITTRTGATDERRWFSLHAGRLRDWRGDDPPLVLSFSDVSELHQAQEVLQETRRRLEGRVRRRTAELGETVDRLRAEVARRKQVEKELLESSQRYRLVSEQKELLLQELHHRVKNNLQIVASMLNLQASRIRDPEDRMRFLESQNRIRAMAFVHARLIRATERGHVEIRDYVEELVDRLLLSLESAGRLRFENAVEPGPLDMDTAITVGLLVNEMVTNSVQHAHPDGGEGLLHVAFERRQGGGWRLVVQDDGIGLPDGLEPSQSPSLGLQLMASLARQQGGRLIRGHGPGTRLEIDVPPSETGEGQEGGDGDER